MADRQAAVAYLLAVGMLALAAYYGGQQMRTLRSLRLQVELPPADSAYVRRQAWLRLSCCGLMLALAFLVAGAYVLGLEEQVHDLGRVVQTQREQGGDINLTPDQEQFRRFYGAYWITVLILLFLLVVLAGIDIWAIARYSRRHFRRIRDDRREMLERQAAFYRTQRNGHH